jgi:hypothetical protein
MSFLTLSQHADSTALRDLTMSDWLWTFQSNWSRKAHGKKKVAAVQENYDKPEVETGRDLRLSKTCRGYCYRSKVNMSCKKYKEWNWQQRDLPSEHRLRDLPSEHRLNIAVLSITTTCTAAILISTYPVMFITDKDNGYMFRLVFAVHRPNPRINIQIHCM